MNLNKNMDTLDDALRLIKDATGAIGDSSFNLKLFDVYAEDLKFKDKAILAAHSIREKLESIERSAEFQDLVEMTEGVE